MYLLEDVTHCGTGQITGADEAVGMTGVGGIMIEAEVITTEAMNDDISSAKLRTMLA